MKGKEFKEAVIKGLKKIPDNVEVLTLAQFDLDDLCPAVGLAVEALKVVKIEDIDDFKLYKPYKGKKKAIPAVFVAINN